MKEIKDDLKLIEDSDNIYKYKLPDDYNVKSNIVEVHNDRINFYRYIDEHNLYNLIKTPIEYILQNAKLASAFRLKGDYYKCQLVTSNTNIWHTKDEIVVKDFKPNKFWIVPIINIIQLCKKCL